MTMFGWVMHRAGKGGGYLPKVCNLEGEIVHSLRKVDRLDQGREVLDRWAKENPDVKLIMMPGNDLPQHQTKRMWV